MTPIYARCSQGHVFEKTSSAAYPVCGEGAVVAKPAEPGLTEPSAPTPPSPSRVRTLVLAGGALGVITLAAWLVMRSDASMIALLR